MQELLTLLKQHEVNVSSFELLFDRGQEKGYYFSVPGSSAISQWQKLRALVDQTGFWPVLIGDTDDLERLVEDLESYEDSTTSHIIERGLTIDAASWLKYRFDDMYEGDEEAWKSVRGDWPSHTKPYNEFTIPYDYVTGEAKETIFQALIPAKISWQIPAYLRFGNWNYCPTPEEHVSVMKYWQELYQVEIVGMSYDVIELQVGRPSQNREQALKLAEEQFTYCPDIVEQGAGTIEALAAGLLGGTAWYFWWD